MKGWVPRRVASPVVKKQPACICKLHDGCSSTRNILCQQHKSEHVLLPTEDQATSPGLGWGMRNDTFPLSRPFSFTSPRMPQLGREFCLIKLRGCWSRARGEVVIRHHWDIAASEGRKTMAAATAARREGRKRRSSLCSLFFFFHSLSSLLLNGRQLRCVGEAAEEYEASAGIETDSQSLRFSVSLSLSLSFSLCFSFRPLQSSIIAALPRSSSSATTSPLW